MFDIDLTDYDDVRTCCSGAKICNRCWSYMTMAVSLICEDVLSLAYRIPLCGCRIEYPVVS